MIRALALLLGLFAAIGSAVAEDGRALVVAGRVMLERAAPGAFSITAVTAGTEIRRGDLIRTGDDGRVQIRFSDGSIISLQPETAFRIDEYRFERDDRRAFFFLLRGALRTLTGAIGKTNHDEYRMKTPTATVGVRGTEYVAEQTVCDPRCAPGPRAGLRVAVTQGRIVLLTNAGEVEVGTGQAASAESADAPPRQTERGPVLPPISLSAPTERTSGRTSTAGATGQNRSTPTARAQPPAVGSDGARGNPDADTVDTFDPAAKGERGSTAPGGTASPAAPAGSGSAASPTGQRDRGPQGARQAIEDSANPQASSEIDAVVGTWPRFFANEAGLPAPVSPNEKRNRDGALLPVLERLAPGTPRGDPTDDSHAGGPDAGGPGTNPGTSPGTGPGDSGAGDSGPGDPGTGNPDPGGPGTGDPGTEPPEGGGPDPSFPALISGVQRIDPDPTPGTRPTLRVLEPWRLGIGPEVHAGSLELDESLQLGAFAACRFELLCRIAKGSTTIEDAGHDAWTSWGRWAGGQAHATAIDLPLLHIAGNEGLHYLVGIPSATIPTSGVFGYDLVGATRATLSGGGETGRFDGRAAVAFSPSGAQIGIDASVLFPSATYRFATPGGIDDLSSSPIVTGAGHAFSGEIAATGKGVPRLDCSGGCPVRIDGGLFGPEAARLGITYRITGSGDGPTISGVGVFGKKNPPQ